MTEAEPLIFISYASPDQDRVDPFADALQRAGFNVWMDHRRLVAGQDWDAEIRRALNKAVIVVVFMSEISVDRQGYAQKEIRLSLQKAEEKLTSDIYIIPVLLDKLPEYPSLVKHLHMVRAWEADASKRIEEAVSTQIAKIGQHARAVQKDSRIRWTERSFKEKWDGLPGYELEYNLFDLHSSEIENVGDITTVIKGEMSKLAMDQRTIKYHQDSGSYSFGQDKYRRTNNFSAYCREPTIVNHVLSMNYMVHWYNAGAAHGMEMIKCYNFTLEPVTLLPNPIGLFTDQEKAFQVVQGLVRSKLLDDLAQGEGDRADCASWIAGGTEAWTQFEHYSFSPDGVEFHFPPYQVACYADGIRTVLVSKWDIYPYLQRHLVEALGWEHLQWHTRPVQPAP